MKSERLIVVDDNLAHLHKISNYLIAEGFDVAIEPDSKNALNRLLNEDFDLVLIKQEMADYDGLSIMKQLQQEGSKSSFIIMVDSLDIKQAVDIMQEGAYSILTMPYEKEQLKGMLIKGFKNKHAFLEILQLSDNLVKTNIDLKDKKIRLEEEQQLLKSKIDELNLLNKLSFLMSSSLNPEKIIDSLVKNLKETLHFDIFSAMMIDGKEIFLKIHSSNELEKDFLDKINLNIHKSFAKYIGNTQYLNKLAEKTTGRSAKVINIHKGSELDFNLQVAGKKLGVLKIIRFSNEPFTQDQKSLLSTVSNQLALFLNNALEHKKYLSLAAYDPLTNILNRRTLDDIMEREFNRSARYKTTLSVVMFDLDHFKKINDTWGHQAGDIVLKKIAGIVNECLRDSDIFARYGGEEFIAVLPQTSIEKSSILADRIRKAIEDTPIKTPEGQINVTSSIGIASYPFSPVKDKNELLKMADNALYQAKKNGRNCVYIHSKDNKYREIKIQEEGSKEDIENRAIA